MLQKFVGEERFKSGMNHFIANHAYKSGGTEDLYGTLEEIVHRPISNMMNSWTKQMGYPLLRIVSSRYEMNQRSVVISQEKFWSDPLGRENKQLNKEYLWAVPIAISLGSNPTKAVKEVLMEKRTIHITIPNVTRHQWFKVSSNAIYAILT
jgi:puromycin-sensitive aminopeptidase